MGTPKEIEVNHFYIKSCMLCTFYFGVRQIHNYGYLLRSVPQNWSRMYLNANVCLEEPSPKTKSKLYIYIYIYIYIIHILYIKHFQTVEHVFLFKIITVHHTFKLCFFPKGRPGQTTLLHRFSWNLCVEPRYQNPDISHTSIPK